MYRWGIGRLSLVWVRVWGVLAGWGGSGVRSGLAAVARLLPIVAIG